jgi:hypothetical protein
MRLVPRSCLVLSQRLNDIDFNTGMCLCLHWQVRIFSVHHLLEVWQDCNATPTALKALPGSGGLVLAEFSDSSVRLLEASPLEVGL